MNQHAVNATSTDLKLAVVTAALGLCISGCGPSSQAALASAPSSSSSSSALLQLGSAAPFSVLAATTVTNTGPTSIAGELGLSAGTDVTGAPVVVGAQHIDDDVARAAQVCLDVCGDLLTDNDNDNCGACGNVCGENGTCGGGVCRLCP